MQHWVHRCVNNWATSETQFIPDWSRSLLSPTSSASDLRVYYNKLAHAKETPPQQITPEPASPQSCSSSSTSPPTLISTTSTTTVPTIDTVSLEEGLSCLFQDILVDITLLLALMASTDQHPNQLEYYHWYLRLNERWGHVRHLCKRAQEIFFDITMCSVGVRLGMRVKDYTSARAAAFKFFDLMDHPLFVYMPLPPSIVVPILEYFEEMQDAENLAYLLSRLRLLHNASYLKAPSLTAILARINPLVREFSSSLFRLSMLERG